MTKAEPLEAMTLDTLRRLNDEQSELFGKRAVKYEGLYEQLGKAIRVEMLREPRTVLMHPDTFSDLERSLRGEPFYGPGIPEMLPVGTLTGPAVVALTTFCALEWLRHRKHEVAAAEASGDYSGLIAEFVTWLRVLLAGWREKIGT